MSRENTTDNSCHEPTSSSGDPLPSKLYWDTATPFLDQAPDASARIAMDASEPDQTPFAVVSAQTSRLGRVNPHWKISQLIHLLRKLRTRYTNPTSTKPPPTPHTDGSEQVPCSLCSSSALSWLRAGISVRILTSSFPLRYSLKY